MTDPLRLSADRAYRNATVSDVPCHSTAWTRGFHTSHPIATATPKDDHYNDSLARADPTMCRLKPTIFSTRNVFDPFEPDLLARHSLGFVKFNYPTSPRLEHPFRSPKNTRLAKVMGFPEKLLLAYLQHRSASSSRGTDASYRSLQPTYCHEHPPDHAILELLTYAIPTFASATDSPSTPSCRGDPPTFTLAPVDR